MQYSYYKVQTNIFRREKPKKVVTSTSVMKIIWVFLQKTNDGKLDTFSKSQDIA